MTKYFVMAIAAIGLLGWGFWSLVGGLPWYWIVAIVAGIWFFGTLVWKAFSSIGALFLVGIFIFLDAASKKRRSRQYERIAAKQRDAEANNGSGRKGY